MLFVVCQTRLGSLGVFHELETLLHSTKYKFISFSSFFDLTQIDVEQTLTRSDINRKTTARLCGGNLI